MSSSENAFTKQLRPETTADKVEGLLEHFNLPPAVIAFIRRNLRLIQIGLGIVVVIVVTVSLYSSYRERMIQDAASALSNAMNQQGDAETVALQKVVVDYSTTKAAVWAKIELAHLAMKNNNFSQAAEQYENILKELDSGNPSYPLVLFGLAQAYEADKKYDAAAAQYDKLKEITGYTQLSYAALGRIAEAQGDIEKAIATYNNYLLTVGDDPARKSAVEEFNNQIARLKTQQ